MKTVESDLLGNNFPYPQYFDGDKWNTVTENKRNSIPSYLKSELPKMKFQKVKAKFQQMNKFVPPEITYFERMIKTSRNSRRSSSKKITSQQRKQDKNQQTVQNLKQDLQYALIMTNRNSKILVDIVDKVNKAEKRLSFGKQSQQQLSFQQKLMQTKRSQSQQLGRSARDCFSNTIDLVFSLKKKQCVSRSRQNPESDLKEQIQNRINSIRLRTLEAV